LRVLVISQYFWPEQFRFNDLIEGLKDQGCEVTVLTGLPNYPDGQIYSGYKFFFNKPETYNGARVFRSPLIPRGKSKIQLALNYISFPIFSIVFGLFKLRNEKFDKIFVPQLSPIYMVIPAIFFRFIWKIPLTIWVTDLWPESIRATGDIQNKLILSLVNKSVSFIYQRVDQMLVSCRGFSRSIKLLGYKREINYFPYWSEDFYFPISLADKNFPKDILDNHKPNKKTLLFAGNIGKAQNLSLLVEAVNKLSSKDDLRIIILGDGRDRVNIEALVRRLNLDNIFEFYGSKPAEDMPFYFALSDVLYLSLKKDPIFALTVPSKVQSYMACKKPILASIDGEVQSLLREAKCGFSSESENLEELINQLEKLLLLEKQDLEDLGENAYQFYEKNFSRSLAMSHLESYLNSAEIKQ
jgi:glycosyltransferase involved in cell wall biosynthesis